MTFIKKTLNIFPLLENQVNQESHQDVSELVSVVQCDSEMEQMQQCCIFYI